MLVVVIVVDVVIIIISKLKNGPIILHVINKFSLEDHCKKLCHF